MRIDDTSKYIDYTTKYEDLLKNIPIPTWDQCERFVRYVSQDRTWFKLPVDSSHRFFFFLDPGLGVSEFAQFRATAEFHEQFGYWNYDHAAAADELGVRFGPGTSKAPHVEMLDGRELFLPEAWRNAGCASVDAWIHPAMYSFEGRPQQFLPPHECPAEDEPLTDFTNLFRCVKLSLQERLDQRTRRLKEILEDEIPLRFRAALRSSETLQKRSAFICGPVYRWPDADWRKQLADMQVPAAYWDPLCKYFELLAHEARIRGDMDRYDEICRRDGGDYPPYVDRAFYPMAMAEERVIQLQRSTEAMNRFLAKVVALR